MTFDEIVSARRSIRSYQPQPVEPEKLAAVLEAGRMAPSARNAQTWHFTAVTHSEMRQQLCVACNNQPMVAQAPAVLVIWSDTERMMSCGQSAATVDCSIALSFMMLKATELGLGTCWLGSFSSGQVKQLLALPQDATVVAVTPLGYPAEEPAPRPRKPLAEVSQTMG